MAVGLASIPRVLASEEQQLLAMCYSADGQVVRHAGKFAVLSRSGKYVHFAAYTVGELKADGYLKIIKSSTRTGRETKLLPSDLYVEHLALTAKGESLGSACAAMRGKPIHYFMDKDEVVYGELRDFGMLHYVVFSIRFGSTRLPLLERLKANDLLTLAPRPTNKNPDSIGVFMRGGVFLGALPQGLTDHALLTALRFNAEHLHVSIVRVGDRGITGVAIVRTRDKKTNGLPDEPTHDSLKKALGM